MKIYKGKMVEKTILLSHGGGGEEMNKLINDTIFRAFNNEILRACNDAAILKFAFDDFATNGENFGSENLTQNGENLAQNFSREISTSNKTQNSQNFTNNFTQNFMNLAFTTDSFVVTPLFFNGGDIGKIAVCGTINDLSMVGAKPLFLSVAFIIEEGLKFSDFERILGSITKTAKEAGVKIVCGDTKVVPRGKADEIFINTSGVGRVLAPNIEIGAVKKGAKVLISGDIGRHGAVIMAARDEIAVSTELVSDCKPLNGVVEALLNEGVKILAMRDATRGGLSAVLNEFSAFNKCEILVREANIKVADEVAGICELLGFEPYDLANEGTFVLFVENGEEQKALEILRNFNPNAAIIGEVTQNDKARVILKTTYGSERFLELPKGELLPRIC